MTALKYSRQRQEIKRYLVEHMDHPTAETIYTALKQDDPKLSLGTVYRNLSLLTSTGEIKRLQTGDGYDHFDADTSVHQHFMCRMCGCIKDIHPVGLEGMVDKEAHAGAFTAEEAVLTVYGLCSECREKCS